MATSLVTGVAFGAALAASGMHNPAVIISQFKFETFDMLQTFLAAAATTTILVAAVDGTGSVSLKPRAASGLGLFSRYDGNILGGAILGAGMALSAACPGVSFAQAALGVRSGQYALQGGLAGGVVYTSLLAPLIARRRGAFPACSAPPATVHETARVPRVAAFLASEAVYAAVIASAILYAAPSPFSPLFAPALGGLLIGAAQLLSLALRGSLIGVSSAFPDAARYATWVASGAPSDSRPKSYASILFAAGLAAGSYALSLAYPSVVPAAAELTVPAANALAGGFLFIIGATMAGGCTSGHGISGLSLLSVASFITIACTFAGGAAVAMWAY